MLSAMDNNITSLERAFALAKSGKCNSVTDIKHRLNSEGYSLMAFDFGSSLRKQLRDLIDAAKKAPGTIRASTTGILSDDHLNILITEEAANVKFRIVHLEGAAGQLKETLGGNVDVSFDNVGSVVKPLKAGQIRVLAVTDPERSKFLPEIPSTKELGYAAIVSSSTRGLVGPKGTPEAVVKKLGEIFKKAMDDPEHQKRMDEQGLGVKPLLAAEFAAFWKEQHERAKKYTDWAKKRPQ